MNTYVAHQEFKKYFNKMYKSFSLCFVDVVINLMRAKRLPDIDKNGK